MRFRPGLIVTAILAATALGSVGFIAVQPGSLFSSFLHRPEKVTVGFVGSEACAECHRAEAEWWRGSQHKHAMDHATEKSVLGDFSDATFDYNGIRSRFFRKNDKFFVETDGPDGTLTIFEVKYTFGVDPLQQYLIELPGGRLQALSIAWDSRPNGEGGQRWFHLYPNENVKRDDILHWTKLSQNWNFMCAECHSTGIRKGYDASSDRYATTWREISVGCEACHGEGSNHVNWARAQGSWLPFNRTHDRNKGLIARFNEREGVVWLHDSKTGHPQRNLPVNLLRTEVEACGRCHARRAEISEKWQPGHWLQDTHVVARPLDRSVYWPDGQIRNVEEAYNYAPFKQSKMFAAGVTCSDCHDPHSGKMRVAGNGVCLQCHSSETYETTKHSHHNQGNATASACVACHMPARTYMVVDIRHDHSIRIPRPDLSTKIGTPNACNYCHTDKGSQWAATAIERWFGRNRKGFQTYAEAFAAVDAKSRDAESLLAAVAADRDAPGIARAAALSDLARYISTGNAGLARDALSDPDPMVRIAALDMLANVPPLQIWPAVAPLLSDPVRGVRTRAVDLLASVPNERQPDADKNRFEAAAAELVASLRLNADRPEGRTTLANFYVQRGQILQAETEYKAALRLSPQYSIAAINLADLYRQTNRDSDGETTLRRAIATSPKDAALHHALGLALNRLQRSAESINELEQAQLLDPRNARFTYVYGVALHSAGRAADAVAVLKNNLGKHPNDQDTLLALVTFNRDAGNAVDALTYAEQLRDLFPNDQSLSRLIQTLQAQVEQSKVQ